MDKMKQLPVEKLTVHNVHDCFEYHPWDEEQTQAGIRVRGALEAAAIAIIESVPDCPDRSVALRKIREARMDANSAITHHGRF
jgi:hypothetical protein